MLAELSSADITEFMIAGCHVAGQYPVFLPVIDGKDFGAIVGKAIPGAKKIVEG